MKSGIRTTEAWIAFAVTIILAAIQAYQGEINAGASLAMAITAAVYAGFRTYLKTWKHDDAEKAHAMRPEGQAEES